MVGIEPAENAVCHSFKEAHPACKRNNPEILIFNNGSERINKLDTDNVCFSLNNFFLGVLVKNKTDKEADNEDGCPYIAVDADIVKVSFACDDFAYNRNYGVCDCGRK